MSSWIGHSIDPIDISARFSNEDGMSFMDSIFEESSEEDKQKIEVVKDLLKQLPAREADFIDLYFFKKKKQTDIADIFNVSQPTVCYRLIRAADRIKFLMNLPAIEKDKMIKDLTGFLSDPLDISIMVMMWETTCQSEVAKRLSVSQGLVRHRFLRTLNRMKDNSKFSFYVDLFQYISDHLNVLREVQRPILNDNVTHCIR